MGKKSRQKKERRQQREAGKSLATQVRQGMGVGSLPIAVTDAVPAVYLDRMTDFVAQQAVAEYRQLSNEQKQGAIERIAGMVHATNPEPTEVIDQIALAIIDEAKRGNREVRDRLSLPLFGPHTRECGECRACCVVVATGELGKPYYADCEHLCMDPAKGGCGIYEQRPLECRTYECLWLMGMLGTDDRAMRPDNLGLLFNMDTNAQGLWLEVMESRPGLIQGFADSDEEAAKLSDLVNSIVETMTDKFQTTVAGVRFYPFNSVVGLAFEVNRSKYRFHPAMQESRGFLGRDDFIYYSAMPIEDLGATPSLPVGQSSGAVASQYGTITG
jgi:hypothetical protein